MILSDDYKFAAICEAYNTKVSRNANMAKLQAGYLFPEVFTRMCTFLLYNMFMLISKWYNMASIPYF